MTPFIITDTAGIVVRSGAVANPADIDIQPLGPGESITPGLSGRAGKDRLNAAGEIEPLPPPQPTLAEQKAALLARLAERRYEIEISGVDFGGVVIPTDRHSQFMLSTVARKAEADPSQVKGWKTGPGIWIDMSASQIIAAADLVYDRVDALFLRERELSDQILAAEEITPTLQAVVEDFWPL